MRIVSNKILIENIYFIRMRNGYFQDQSARGKTQYSSEFKNRRKS